MQDNENPHTVDNDILQCKADILKALGRTGQAAQTPRKEDAEQPVFLDPAAGQGIRIVPFESPARKPAPADPAGAPANADQESPAASASSDDDPIIVDDEELDLSDLDDTSTPAVAQDPADTGGTAVSEIPIEDEGVLAAEVQQLLNPAGAAEDGEEIFLDDEAFDLTHIDSEEVHAENGHLRETLEHTRSLLKDQRDEAERLERQLHELNETIKPMQAANEHLKRQIDELTAGNLAAAEQWMRDKQQFTDEAALADTRLQELAASRKELQSALLQNQSLRQALTETEAALSQGHVKIRELENQVRRLCEEKETSQSELEQSKQTGQELQTQEAHLRAEMEKLQAVYTRFRHEAEREINDLNHRAQQVIGQLQQAEKKTAQQQEKIGQLEHVLQEAQEQKLQLEQARGEHDTALAAELTELREKADARKETYRQAVTVLQDEITRLRQREQTLEAQLTEAGQQARAQQDDNSRRAEDSQRQLAELQRHNTELLAKAGQFEQAIAAAETRHQLALDAWTAEKAELEQQRDALKNELDETRQQFGTKQTAYNLEIEELKQRQQTLQSELADSRRELDGQQARHQQTLNDLHRQGQELRQELDDMLGRFEAQQQHYAAQIEGMQQEISHLRQREESLLSKAAKVDQTIGEQVALQKEAMERMQQELVDARQRQEAAENELADVRRLSEAAETQYCRVADDANAQKAALEQQVQQLEAEKDRLAAEIQSLRCELDRRSAIDQSAAHEGRKLSTAADSRLEVTLEPEEMSALMDFADEEPADHAPAEISVCPIAENAEPDAEIGEPAESGEIPAFSLADLILSEHRRKSTVRRQRVEPSSRPSAPAGIRQVVRQYVQSDPPAPTPPAPPSRAARMWEDDFLTPFQRELLQEIIQNDIKRLGQKTIQRNTASPSF